MIFVDGKGIIVERLSFGIARMKLHTQNSEHSRMVYRKI